MLMFLKNLLKLFFYISFFFRLENPINVPKTANTKITTLRIQEQQYFGSLTCHVLRDTSNSIFNHFNATTRGLAFSNADTYDPYNFGKKREKFYNCDIYLTNSDFPDLVVDLEIVLILQPLLRRQSINLCDVPLITRQTVHIEFACCIETFAEGNYFLTKFFLCEKKNHKKIKII